MVFLFSSVFTLSLEPNFPKTSLETFRIYLSFETKGLHLSPNLTPSTVCNRIVAFSVNDFGCCCLVISWVLLYMNVQFSGCKTAEKFQSRLMLNLLPPKTDWVFIKVLMLSLETYFLLLNFVTVSSQKWLYCADIISVLEHGTSSVKEKTWLPAPVDGNSIVGSTMIMT